MKRQPAMIFTAKQSFVTTWAGSPRVEGETARVTISRKMAADMLRKIRKNGRQAA